MINGVRRAQAGQFADSAVMSRKLIINVINVIDIINDKWGPPGPGKAVWGLCRNDSGKMRTVDCLYGANPSPERGPLGSGEAAWGQCRDDIKCNNEYNKYDTYNEWRLAAAGRVCTKCTKVK